MTWPPHFRLFSGVAASAPLAFRLTRLFRELTLSATLALCLLGLPTFRVTGGGGASAFFFPRGRTRPLVKSTTAADFFFDTGALPPREKKLSSVAGPLFVAFFFF